MRRTRGASLGEIERVYRDHFDELRRTAAAICGDGDASFEIVQEAFAGIVGRRRSFARRGPVDAWIWRAVVNTALNRRRRDRRQTALPSAASNGHAPEHPLAADVHEQLAQLPERQRLALFLRYYADLDYAAIADVLGTSVGTVSSTLHAAHGTLRTQLEEIIR